jgi:hypothetical protein
MLRAFGPPGFWFARSFRFASFPRKPSLTFCQPWSLLRKALIRAGKTSYTAGRYVPCFRFSGYISHVKINFKKREKSLENSLMGKLNTITPHDTAVKHIRSTFFNTLLERWSM